MFQFQYIYLFFPVTEFTIKKVCETSQNVKIQVLTSTHSCNWQHIYLTKMLTQKMIKVHFKIFRCIESVCITIWL